MRINHFGINIFDKPTNHICKDHIVNAPKEKNSDWCDESIAIKRKQADINYDLNMAYFESLDHGEFMEYIQKQTEMFHFMECLDLNDVDGVCGIYIMVLDCYNQIYIGKAEGIDGIKGRMLSHWNKKKPIEKIVTWDLISSILPIDCFGALDTTRVYYLPIPKNKIFKTEEVITSAFDKRYQLNRVPGGYGSQDTYTDTKRSVEFAIMGNLQERNMIKFLDFNRLSGAVFDVHRKLYLKKYPELVGYI